MALASHLRTRAFERALVWLHRVEDGLLAVLLGSMVLLAAGQVLLRNLFDTGLAWADPMLRILVLWVGLMGALAASRDDKHISIDVLPHLMPPRPRAAVHALTSLATALVAGAVAWFGLRFVQMEYAAGAMGLAGLPSWVLELVIPIAFGLISLRYLLHCVVQARAFLSMGRAS